MYAYTMGQEPLPTAVAGVPKAFVSRVYLQWGTGRRDELNLG